MDGNRSNAVNLRGQRRAARQSPAQRETQPSQLSHSTLMLEITRAPVTAEDWPVGSKRSIGAAATADACLDDDDCGMKNMVIQEGRPLKLRKLFENVAVVICIPIASYCSAVYSPRPFPTNCMIT